MPGRVPRSASLVDLPLGGLVGRSTEAAAIKRMLDGHRLVTVTGLPGVGKTAVSLEAAAANFADGAVLVRLDALRDETLLPHSILAALRYPDPLTSSPLQVLVDQLRDRHMLLVFDNCEHLLGSCAAVIAALLQFCAKVQVLATSREPLRVPGEFVLNVSPLPLQDAVELFSWRAGLQITAENRATVASICVQLDQLPLAIELAAGQPVAVKPASLLAAIETNYDVLRDPGNPVFRHRSLRAAIGWSDELCTPTERLLWARLSVFPGPFQMRDAQDVCTTSRLSREEVAAGLILLTERSVLLADFQAGGEDRGAIEDQEARGDRGAREGWGECFLLPTTLRAYGRQMLRRLAEEAEFQDRYQRWHRSRWGDRGTPAE